MMRECYVVSRSYLYYGHAAESVVAVFFNREEAASMVSARKELIANGARAEKNIRDVHYHMERKTLR